MIFFRFVSIFLAGSLVVLLGLTLGYVVFGVGFVRWYVSESRRRCTLPLFEQPTTWELVKRAVRHWVDE